MSLTESTPFEAARAASLASRTLATLSNEKRNEALTALHDALLRERKVILEANARDLALAQKATENGELRQSTFKRLDLTRPGKFEDMLKGILDVRGLEYPIGRVTLRTELDDGLELERVSCPIGVLLIIFEARPEVIANIASLAIKSGNAAILKGGKESSESFQAIQLVKTRDVIDQLLGLDQFIDLVIPRGGNELVRYIKEHTKIPVLGHADGLCSIYIHSDADPATAVPILADAKCGYPAACNAVETLLVHEDVLSTVLPPIVKDLLSRGVSLRCDPESKAALTSSSSSLTTAEAALLQDAVLTDYDTEFLDLILAVKTIPARSHDGTTAIDTAISHINAHSSHHTAAILTKSKDIADRFFAGVDSAGVYWNASTRFADGMRYGFGTEVGISTNKIHSRGPVGLEGLTIYKYLIRGSGQTAGMYGGNGGRVYKHKKLL